MAKTTSRLGKGLSALIQPAAAGSSAFSVPAGHPQQQHATGPDHIRSLPVDQLSPNPNQPRQAFPDDSLRELADSIRATGVLQPIIVRPAGPGRYEVVAGERRLRAARLAGKATIPAIIRELSDAESLRIALLENLQREDLAPLERAAAYERYLESFGGTVDELAKQLCESRGNISNYLRLMKLHADVRYLLARGELAMGQARAVAAISDPQRQLAIAKLAVRRNLSVRQVEELARRADTPPSTETTAPAPRQRHLQNVEEALSKAVGLRVRINAGRRKNSGRVVITYANLEEFDRIAEKLGGRINLE